MAIKEETERKYKPQEIADEWGLHVKTVRNLFSEEEGVLQIGPRPGKRSYRTLRIPRHVMERVFDRMRVKPPVKR